MRGVIAMLPPIAVALLGALALFVSWFGVIIILFGALDTYGRWRDYRYLARFNYLTERLALFYGHSFCGRWVVICVEPRWRRMYRRKGYRWWHILPNGFPGILINRRFWRATLRGHRSI